VLVRNCRIWPIVAGFIISKHHQPLSDRSESRPFAERSICMLRKYTIVYDPQRPAEEFHAQLPAQARCEADKLRSVQSTRSAW
jgi:hypothetical protein